MPKIITFGEIMLRLATPDYLRFAQAGTFNATFGGGEANVAVSLANYGMDAEFVSRFPDNDIARACIADLHKHGVGTKYSITGGERLGIYFLETGAVARPSKVVYDRAHSAISEIQKGMIDWYEVFKGADWFHWTGITPALSQGAADVCLEAAKAANRLGVTVSCDLNYRKNLWKYGKKASEIMPDLVACSDIILGNEEDAEKVFGIKPEGFDVTATGGEIDQARFRSVGEQLMEKFPRAKKVIITLRGSINANHNTWGGVLFDGEKLYHGMVNIGNQPTLPSGHVTVEAHILDGNPERLSRNLKSTRRILEERISWHMNTSGPEMSGKEGILKEGLCTEFLND